jgi:hypothetical protein
MPAMLKLRDHALLDQRAERPFERAINRPPGCERPYCSDVGPPRIMLP